MPTEDQIEAARTKVRNMLQAADHGNEEGARSQDHAPSTGSVTSGQSHTPGPWFAHKSSSDWWAIGPEDTTYSPVVASTWATDRNQVANARLIAAAPEQRDAAAEIDRLLLVIESAVRNADPANHAAVLAALKANRTALSLAQPYEAEVEKVDGLQTNVAPQCGVGPSDLTGQGGEP